MNPSRERALRSLATGAIVFLFLACWVRSIGWPWLAMDDAAVLGRCPFLNDGVASLLRCLTDVTYGRRWMPVFWCLAWLGAPFGVAGYHVITVLVGALLCLLVCSRAFVRWGWFGYAVAIVLLFSPARAEIFGWAIGFLYVAAAAAIFGMWDAVESGRYRVALAWAVFGLLVYPVTAGFVLWVICRAWRAGERVALPLLFFALYFVSQMVTRVLIGYVPFSPRFDLCWWVLPHYFGMAFVPVFTMPLDTPGFYPLLLVPVLALSFLVPLAPRWAGWFLIVMLPVLQASVTESFWAGGRYGVVADIAIWCPLACWLVRYSARTKLLRWLVAVLAVVFVALSFAHDGYSSQKAVARRAIWETSLLYGRTWEFQRAFGTWELPSSFPPPKKRGTKGEAARQ